MEIFGKVRLANSHVPRVRDGSLGRLWPVRVSAAFYALPVLPARMVEVKCIFGGILIIFPCHGSPQSSSSRLSLLLFPISSSPSFLRCGNTNAARTGAGIGESGPRTDR